jgi:hypothetical protein
MSSLSLRSLAPASKVSHVSCDLPLPLEIIVNSTQKLTFNVEHLDLESP